MTNSRGTSTVAELISRRNDSDEINPDADVLIKSESHDSRQDLREELDLLQTNEFDAVVFEMPRESVEEISQSSFYDLILGLMLFILKPLYQNTIPLISAAGRTGTTPYYTREKDGDVIQDLSLPLRGSIALLWVLCLALTGFFGLVDGTIEVIGINVAYSSLSLLFFLSAFVLPFAIRVIRNRVGGEYNRNSVIARKIEDAHMESGRTLVILGNKHTPKVMNELSDDLDVSEIPMCHSMLSVDGLKVFLPGSLKVVLLFVMTWLFTKTAGSYIVLLLLSVFI